jgi:hypothetical protein
MSKLQVDSIDEVTSANGVTVDGLNIKDGKPTTATAITGQTAETTVADDDTVLIHDTSASALRKMTVSNLTANAGVAGITSSADATAITITDAELVQVKNTNDTGGLLSVSDGDSGATASADANELVLEDNGSAGMSILTFNNTTGNVYFGDGQDNDVGKVSYNHSTNALELTTNGAAQWSLDSSGNWLPAATDHGIYLGTTSATAANLLDDYEEGTWTPTFTHGGSAVSNLTINKANYTKVGRLVYVSMNARYTGSDLTGGDLIGAGLPFTSAAGNVLGVTGAYLHDPGSGNTNYDAGIAGSHDSNTNFYMIVTPGGRYQQRLLQNYYFSFACWYFV